MNHHYVNTTDKVFSITDGTCSFPRSCHTSIGSPSQGLAKLSRNLRTTIGFFLTRDTVLLASFEYVGVLVDAIWCRRAWSGSWHNPIQRYLPTYDLAAELRATREISDELKIKNEPETAPDTFPKKVDTWPTASETWCSAIWEGTVMGRREHICSLSPSFGPPQGM